MALSYLNASYSVFSYALRRLTGISLHPPLPPAVSVEVSSVCNLACPECVTGRGLIRRHSRFISYDLAAAVASQLRGRALSAWLSFQGEPMMHPEFFRIAGLFRGMRPVISTNGHWLDREGCIRLADSPLKEIIISYDGVTPETYGLYRKGGDHGQVTRSVRLLAETVRHRRSRLRITLQFIVHKGNEHEVAAAAAFAAVLGARFVVKSMQVLDQVRAGEWMPTDPHRARYVRARGEAAESTGESGTDAETWRSRRGADRGCLRMWRSAVITCDGDVVPCCYDKNGDHAMGNLNDQTLREIWHGEQYRAFRRQVMTDRKQIGICRDCPEGSRLFFRR